MRKFLKQIAVNLAVTLVVIAGFCGTSAAEPQRLVVLGDSLVQGYGLPQGDGFVPQLERWLEAQGRDVTVINAGVSGDTTAGGAARIEWTLSDRPDAMIVLLGGNDLLRGAAPQDSRANLAQILARASEAGVKLLLIGMQAPLNYGADYKQQFDAIYPELAEEYGALLHPSAFLGMTEAAGEDPAGLAPYLQPDGIHPNAEGVALNVASVGPLVLKLLAGDETQRRP